MKTEHGTLNVPNDPTPWVIVRPNTNKDWAVLWLQGWTSTIEGHLEGLERMAKTSGVTFAMMDYAGHGAHPMPLDNTTKQMQHIEVLTAYDELVKLDYKNIVVIGGSFGGYMAALLAGKRNPTAVILRAPAAYPNDEFSDVTYKDTVERRAEGADRHAFMLDEEGHLQSTAFEAIAGYAGPVYVMEHEIDEVVPRVIPRLYFANAKHGNYLRVPNTAHSPKTMKNPQKHFAYIEHMLVSIIKLIQLTP